MFYVLAYPTFSSDLAARIDRLRAQYEPERARLVPPHITLVFGLSQLPSQDLIEHCDAVLEGEPAFDVTFSSLTAEHDPFEDTHKLFLLCGQGKDRLTDLHRRLYDGPHRAEFDPRHPYCPHMTIATDRDAARIAALDARDLGALPLRVRIGSATVVAFVDGKITTLRDFRLAG